MTRKAIGKQIDQIIARVAEAHGLDPRTGAKGGEIEFANAKVWEAIRAFTPQILASTNPPKPPVTQDEVEALLETVDAE